MLYLYRSAASHKICCSIFVPHGASTVLTCDCGFYQVGLTPYTECPKCQAEAVCVGAIQVDAVYVVRPQRERWAKEDEKPLS